MTTDSNNNLIENNNHDDLLNEYLSLSTCNSDEQELIAQNWNLYSNKLKNILIEYKICDLEHVKLLTKYFISNTKLETYVYTSKTLLRHHFITEDINNYMKQLPIRVEFILRLRTNTFGDYDKDLQQEYLKNKIIIDYELNISKQDFKVLNDEKLSHLTLLNDLVKENNNIGYTRKNQFKKFYSKIISPQETSKLELNILNIEKLLIEIKDKLKQQNELIDSLNKHIDMIEPRVYSLEECASLYDVSRERIRQIESKAVDKLKYKFLDSNNPDTEYVFTFNYDANRKQLQDYCMLHPVVYLMNKDLKKKEFTLFFTENNLVDTPLFKSFLTEESLIYFSNKFYRKTQASVFKFWVTEELKRPFNVVGIEREYTRFLHDKNLAEYAHFDKRTIEGLLERNKDIVRSHSLYHKIKVNKKDELNKYIDQIIDDIPEVFSTKLIYNMNEKLFLSADIKDYYELHNYLKKNYVKKNLKYKRVPHIFKGDANLHSFINKNLADLDSHKIEIEDLSNQTGIAVETLLNTKSTTI